MFLLVVTLGSAGTLIGCSKSPEVHVSAGAAASPVSARVLEVSEQAWPLVAATQGNLEADEITIVGAKVAGRIGETPVDLGDFVSAGSVVAALDRQEYLERLRQAEAELTQARAAIGLDPDDDVGQLDPNASPIVVEQKALWDQARAERDRVASLRARQAATDAQYETVVAAERVAEARHRSALNSVREKIAVVRLRTAQVEIARQELNETEIRVPFDGRVQERHVSPGMYVQVGDPIVTIIRDDPLRYRGTVPEPFAASLAVGQRVVLRIGTGPELPEVTITRISPAIDPFSRSLLFEARVPNPEHSIRAGQFAQGEVLLDQSRRTYALPQSAIVEFAGTQKVWKVVEGEAIEQSIKTGERRGKLVEILSGIGPGDQVLLDGDEGRPGKVEVRELVATIPVGKVDGSLQLSGAQ